MVFIYFIYFSFLLSYILQNNLVRQCHNYSPDELFVLSTREYYSACTANLLIRLASDTLFTEFTDFTSALRFALASSSSRSRCSVFYNASASFVSEVAQSSL